MPFFPHARRAGPDPAMPWKLGAIAVGAILFITGAATGSDVMVGVAILVLVLGVAIGFLLRPPKRGEAGDELEATDEPRPVEEESREAAEPKSVEEIEDEDRRGP